MRRRTFIALSVGVALRSAPAAGSSSPVTRIGWLTAQSAGSLAPYLPALRAGLADLGYEEGGNLLIEYRYGDDSVGRVAELAAELVRVPVSLIVAQGTAASVVRRLGLAVPTVFVISADPIAAGLAETLARPRDNMTGLTFMAAEMNGKRIELLQEIVPNLRSVGLIANPEHPGEPIERAYCEDVARRLGLALAYFPTRTREELSAAFRAMADRPPQALCVFADGFAVQNRNRLIEFGMAQRIPVISGWSVFAQSGAVCTYGPRLTASYRRLAYYVDRILKGAKPSDLPIEQPTEFELIINQRSASALGLAIPPTLLARADEVIE